MKFIVLSGCRNSWNVLWTHGVEVLWWCDLRVWHLFSVVCVGHHSGWSSPRTAVGAVATVRTGQLSALGTYSKKGAKSIQMLNIQMCCVWVPWSDSPHTGVELDCCNHSGWKETSCFGSQLALHSHRQILAQALGERNPRTKVLLPLYHFGVFTWAWTCKVGLPTVYCVWMKEGGGACSFFTMHTS